MRLSQDTVSSETLRYSLAILHLERRFSKRDDLQRIVHSRLKHTAYKADNFSREIQGLCSNVSAIYQDTLSTLPYRIKIKGSSQHLGNPLIADLVRALLLAGVRSAFLWRQLGGSRIKLILARGPVADAASRLASELSVNP